MYLNKLSGRIMKKIVLVMLLSSFFVSPVFADNSGKAYVAADYGTASLTPKTIYDSFGMLRIAGGYHYNQNLSAEVGYTASSDVEGNAPPGSITLSSYSYEAAAIGAFPINAAFDLTAKLGLIHHSLNAIGNGVTVTKPGASNTGIMYGFGVQYHVNSQVSVRAQYEDFGDVSDTSSVKKTAISVGAVYNF
jgi:opacity protein-like surface antigen